MIEFLPGAAAMVEAIRKANASFGQQICSACINRQRCDITGCEYQRAMNRTQWPTEGICDSDGGECD
jgi:hypothetical protein